jgi:PKD repeat protein
VAVVDAYDDAGAQADLAAYRSAYGLPPCTASNGCFEKVNQRGAAAPLPVSDPEWEQEESLDLDAVSAVCPNCHIILVEANSATLTDLQAAMSTAAAMGANQISDSWSATSSSVLSGTYTFPHVATVAASGDIGYPGAGTDNYPAAFPGVTAAGGTTLTAATASSDVRGFSEGAWSLSGAYGGGSGCDLHVAKPAYQTDIGCTGRSYSDLSADADPTTGLIVYDSGNGGWMVLGGTSLATPIIASYYAITGVTSASPRWAYTDSGRLNDVVSGSNGACATNILYICNAGVGYDGPTGAGSISGTVVTGAPGIGGPAVNPGPNQTYTEAVASHSAAVTGGIYRNGRDTTWWVEYGTSTAYGNQTPGTDIGSGTAPEAVTGYLSRLAPGTTYNYRLVAQNSLGTTYGYDYTLTTAAASPTDPIASFTAPSPIAAPGSWTSFDASASTNAGDTITDYSWDFGDGTTADTQTTPTVGHSYTTRASYNVTLTVTNSLGQTDTSTETVRIDDPPTAAFNPSATVTGPGSTVSFDGTPSAPGPAGTITDYSWNFGDGTTLDSGTTPTVSHTYASPGVYTVRLTTTDDLGVAGKVSEVITVDQPTAAFTANPTDPAPGSPTSFDATGSSDPEGTITDYSWDFGDGSPVEDDGSTATTSHTFAARGHYNVTVTITNSLGQTDSSTETVTVDDPPTAALVPLTALVTPGATVSFDGSGSAAGAGGTIADYGWNFGDGTTGDTAATPTASHAYTSPGVYTATLTVTDDLGVTGSTSDLIIVDQPSAAFTANPTDPAAGSSTSFDATGSSDPEGAITDYSWDFGDGSPVEDDGSTATTSHTFAARGHYNVTLTITNSLGQTDSRTSTVVVDDPPTVALAPSATLATPGTTVSFDGTDSAPGAGGSIVDYSWSFGDGATDDTGTTATASHMYTTPGVYTATLTATDDLGVAIASSRQVTVDAPPTPMFTASPNPQTIGSATTFDASGSTDSVGTITAYGWDFGDGSSGSGPVTSHAYGAPGNYVVSLIVTNAAGQTATETLAVSVDTPPSAAPTPMVGPIPVAPPPGLSGRLAAPRNQKLGLVRKHGMHLTLSLSLSGTASFQVTIPAASTSPAHGRRGTHRRSVSAPVIILLRVRGRRVAAGSHPITLKLSRAAIRRLSGRGPVTVTVRITVIDGYGSTITRSIKVTLRR